MGKKIKRHKGEACMYEVREGSIRRVKQVVQGHPDRKWSENPDPRSVELMVLWMCDYSD